MISARNSRLIYAALFGAVLSVSANAEIHDFILEWSGEQFDNNATATGHISIDDSVFQNPGFNNFQDNPGWVTAFDITVTGSTSGDGTWTLADYENIILDTDYGLTPVLGGSEPVTALDLTKELVGQPTSGNGWGTPDEQSGDFNIFTSGTDRGVPAPYGSFYFTITVGDYDSGGIERGFVAEDLLLTSFRPVPAPASLALPAIGAGFLARRRRS